MSSVWKTVFRWQTTSCNGIHFSSRLFRLLSLVMWFNICFVLLFFSLTMLRKKNSNRALTDKKFFEVDGNALCSSCHENWIEKRCFIFYKNKNRGNCVLIEWISLWSYCWIIVSEVLSVPKDDRASLIVAVRASQLCSPILNCYCYCYYY